MMPDPNHETIAEAFAWACAALPGDESEAEAREIFDRVFGLRRGDLLAFPERRFDGAQRHFLESLVARRAGGEPLAYLLGWRGFWNFDLQVTPATLIPRADTERLVELALERCAVDASAVVADLGTGSGAIALAVAHERPRSRVLACDASAVALAVAAANARRLRLAHVCCVRGDWASMISAGSLDLLLSNPPYIADRDPHLGLGDLPHEPLSALASGHDGLDDIRRIVADAPRVLRRGGWILLEHGHDQGAAVRDLLQAAGFAEVATAQDIEGRDRVSLARSAI